MIKRIITIEERAEICRAIPAEEWDRHKASKYVAISSKTRGILFSGDNEGDLETRIEAELGGSDDCGFTANTSFWRQQGAARKSRPR